MKRKFNSFKKEFPPIKLYLDDLKKIANILSEKCSVVSIGTDDCIFLNIDELKELDATLIKDLEISCKNPYLRLSFRPYRAELYFSEDNIENRGLASKLEDIIQKRQRNKLFWWTVNSANILFAISLSLIIYWQTNSLVAAYIAFILLSFAFIPLVIKFKRHTTILLKNKKDDIGFYSRNKDKIILTILGAGIGAVFTLLVQIFTKK